MILSALALLCFDSTTAATVGAAGPVVDTAASCEDVTHRWGGDVVLDVITPSYDTGVEVPAGDGASLTVVGVSANGLDDAGTAHPLDVHVGGMRAAAGVAISGGHVVVSSTSSALSTPRRVVGVTVVVRRCAVVASAAPAPIAATVSPAAPGVVPIATSSAAVNASSSASPTAASGVTASPTLPETGADAWRQSLIGALVIAAGATLVSLGRRRPSVG